MTAQASGSNPAVDRRKMLIEYLIRQKFPPVALGKDFGTLSPAEKGAFLNKQAEKARYQAELMSLSEGDLLELYRVDRDTVDEALKERTERNRAEQEANIRKREAEAPWNQPENNAVWNDWIVDRWLIDEATALLHGKDPRRVSPKAIDDTRLGELSPFVQSYRHLREMLSRAYDSGSLKPTPKERILSVPLSDWNKPPTVTPESVIEWALAHWVVPGSREVPPELLEAMQARGRTIRKLRRAENPTPDERARVATGVPGALPVGPIAAKAERVVSKKGRPPKWKWSLIGKKALGLLHENGEPNSENAPGWTTLTDLENELRDFCIEKWGDSPEHGSFHSKITSWIAEYRKSINLAS